MLDNQVRLRLPQLIESVVARKHGAGMNAAMPRRLDVVLHVSHEECFFGRQLVLRKDFVYFLTLVPDIEVGFVEKRPKAGSR